jgi:hypothetical protein
VRINQALQTTCDIQPDNTNTGGHVRDAANASGSGLCGQNNANAIENEPDTANDM